MRLIAVLSAFIICRIAFSGPKKDLGTPDAQLKPNYSFQSDNPRGRRASQTSEDEFECESYRDAIIGTFTENSFSLNEA